MRPVKTQKLFERILTGAYLACGRCEITATQAGIKGAALWWTITEIRRTVILLDHLLVVEYYIAIGVRMQLVKSMDIFKTVAIGLALCSISNALPISKSKRNSSENLVTVEDEWRTLQPDDKRSEYNTRERLLHRDALLAYYSTNKCSFLFRPPGRNGHHLVCARKRSNR